MLEKDVAAARSIFSLAFGTFAGLADPSEFAADCDYIGSRRLAGPHSAFVAEVDGVVIGSNFASRWGSVGLVGPLTIRPDMWGKGFARVLMSPIMDCLENWKVTHTGLCTFPHSTKHVHLYQQFGFWPRFLTANMSRPVRDTAADKQWVGFSQAASTDQQAILDECYKLTDSIYPGLRLDREITAVSRYALGETILIRDGGVLDGLAVCQCGPDTEAGADKCYIKFAAVRSGANAAKRFGRLLDACEQLARARGMSQLIAGVNLARHEAYTSMLGQGFRTVAHVLSMHRPNEPGYSRPGMWVIDDWR